MNRFLEIIGKNGEQHYFPLQAVDRLTIRKDKTIVIYERKDAFSTGEQKVHEFSSVSNVGKIAEALNAMQENYAEKQV